MNAVHSVIIPRHNRILLERLSHTCIAGALDAESKGDPPPSLSPLLSLPSAVLVLAPSEAVTLVVVSVVSVCAVISVSVYVDVDEKAWRSVVVEEGSVSVIVSVDEGDGMGWGLMVWVWVWVDIVSVVSVVVMVVTSMLGLG